MEAIISPLSSYTERVITLAVERSVLANLHYALDAAGAALASVTCYGVYSSALATGSLPHPLGVQFASLAPPALRTWPLGSRARAEPPTRA